MRRLISFAFLCALSPQLALAQAAPSKDEEVTEDDATEMPIEEAPPAPSAPAEPPKTDAEPKPAPPAAPPEAKAAEAEAEEDAGDMAEAEEDAEAAPTRPPAKGKGAVWGVVSDAIEKDSLPEATVTVVGTKYKTVADEEGRYRLELPPGKYTLRFFFELHQPALVKDVVVRLGKTERIDSEVLPDEAATETFEVETQADTASVEGQVLARQRAVSVGDGVGRAEISKTPASNAAQAAQRVVGANIVGSRFVYVRGLGERYTNALLNDAPLPSPEPDRAAIPLDLFPALILDNLNIVKTFTPDMPADFAGGSVRIQTRELPSKPLLQLGASLGVDDRATFRMRNGERGSPTDFLGFDSGMRDLPKSLEGQVYRGGEDQLQGARDLNTYMSSKRYFTPPNYSVSAVAGNGWALPNDQRLGALVTFNYGRSYAVRDDGIARTFGNTTAADGTGSILKIENDYKLTSGTDRVNWGSLASVSYLPSLRHRITLLGLHTQLADSSAQIVSGRNESRGANIVNTKLRYVSRALNFGQLRGEHDFPTLANARIDWNAALSHASRAEPDTRDTVFQSSDGGNYNSITTPENGAHLFADQGETSVGGGLDWTQPFGRAADASRLKLGGLFSLRSRDFSARRFHYTYFPSEPPYVYSCGSTFYASCPDALYVNSNIGTTGALQLTEDTRPEDAYKASLEIYAAYAMLDLELSKTVRVVGGARVEATEQELDPYSQDPTGTDKPSASLSKVNALPALSLVYAATPRTKFRASLSRTLARPQLRELAPFEYTEYFGARPYSGNESLTLTYINNADLRFEFFPTQREVLAFSFFYKSFENPIENVLKSAGSGLVVQPQNARGGRLVGVELEARRSLEFVTPELKSLTAIANVTLARSEVQLNRARFVEVTNIDRAMVNQAPFVINLALDYANDESGTGVRLLYNVSGKRIVEVGADGFPDAYEQPKHVLDLSVSQAFAKQWQFKLAAANIIGTRTRVTLGSANRDDRLMQSFADSRVFSLSGTYTH